MIKRLFLFLCLVFWVCVSCTKNGISSSNVDESPISTGSDTLKTITPSIATSYFIDIALGFEFGTATEVTRKWKEDIAIHVVGNPAPEVLEELDSIINDLNRLLSSSGIEVNLAPSAAFANVTMYLGSAEEFSNFVPLSNRIGGFSVNVDSEEVIIQALIFVNTTLPSLSRVKHTLREELTQILGLGKDSGRFPDSIFFETSSRNGSATSYSELDELIIQFLYDPRMDTGLNESRVRPILGEIASDFF
ncbi:DUF2927 domain-containing protein [Spongiimicrobium salis]|uniref:DUF2927 domain-containing protein n=1 Tax=Spongiimicrobium salis TaxID=1667022 RepID=UPI00374D8665